MDNEFNLLEEHIEGALCNKGLMKERFDLEKDDIVRNLTPEGRTICEELLKENNWQLEYLKLAKEKFSKYPKEIQVILWQNLINQIKDLKRKELK